jgi:hypothetical protein
MAIHRQARANAGTAVRAAPPGMFRVAQAVQEIWNGEIGLDYLTIGDIDDPDVLTPRGHEEAETACGEQASAWRQPMFPVSQVRDFLAHRGQREQPISEDAGAYCVNRGRERSRVR